MNLRLPKVVTHDAPRKVVALFFAVLIWFAIDAQLHESVTLRNVPVTIRYDRTAVVVEEGAVAVDVTLRGSRRKLQNITSSDLRIMAKVPSDIPPGIFFYNLRVTPDNVLRTPLGVWVNDVVPDQHEIRVDRIVTRHSVPVRVRFDGELREGYKRSRVSVIPTTVDIKGPNRIVKDIREMVTEAIPLDDAIVQDFEVDTRLVPIPGIQAPESVHVAVEIARQSTQQAYHKLPMHALLDPGACLAPSDPLPTVSVTLHGPVVTVEGMNPFSIHPFLNLTSVTNPGRYRRPVHVWIEGAPGVTSEYVHPDMVEIELVERHAEPARPEAPMVVPIPSPAVPPGGADQPPDAGDEPNVDADGPEDP